MNIKSLFKLRGKLSGQDSLILGIIGVIITFFLWWLIASSLSEELVTPLTGELPTTTNLKYVDSDSLLYADIDYLSKLSPTDLATYGLEKRTVYKMLPSPIAVFTSFKALFSEDNLIKNSGYSIMLNLLGYLLAIIISIPLGFVLGLIPFFRGLFSKLFDALRFVPLTAVTGIFMMWFGLGSSMKVSFLAFGIIVYLVPVVVQRIDEVKSVYLKTTFTLGATDWQTIKSVYMPSVFSRISDDIRVLTAISWTYITIAEMLNKSGGIGELIWLAKRQSRIDKAFAILLVIVIIGMLQDQLFKFLDRILFPYKYIAKNKY